ncbi:DUF885 domain-containing protein [Cupriavidus campinensis]|uniref:DUF885 domain-containing protein n=1 Tax=Cupriavidus campinensis TaxID=151783 RepID=A0ABY3ERB6_9BURK|nr:DUF885 domain-containing protein [Cupriavidus campinensis]TSP13445.1 DUF885 domain-containing protein [Cupriavidus campinensis]
MRRFTPLGMLAACLCAGLAACSPYLYKSEVESFRAGVNDLATAYQSGTKGVAAERAVIQQTQLTPTRTRVALSPGCALPATVSAAPAADNTLPCALQPADPAMAPRQSAPRESTSAAPLIHALRDYADALAAITNAQDQEALEAANSKLTGSLAGLASTAKAGLPNEFGAIAGLAFSVGVATLNQRRFDMLKRGVTAANEPVAVLGDAMGQALDTLRKARADGLLLAGTTMAGQINASMSPDDYTAALTTLQAKTDAIETLRRTNARAAADDMVKAHAALAQALNDDTRQVAAVVTALKTFREKARAVQEAFAS